MKRKNPGVSLLVSLGMSFLVLGIAVSVLSSINRAVERSADIGRASQVFFAAESGLEAAFFHHNARGQGVHFMTDPTPDTQKILHSASSAEVTWEIDGRSDPVVGTLKENQKIQIPLFWDDSADPSENPNQSGALSNTFKLTFDDAGIPSNFDFGTLLDGVLFDWAVSRENSSSGLQTFVPQRGSNSDVCAISTTFLCKNDFLTTGSADVDSFDSINGNILPGGATDTLDLFMGDGDSDNFILSFQPLLPFRDTDSDARIEGISFTLEAFDNSSLPKNIYEVTAEVSIGSFEKTISAQVPEKTTIGAFDYVIFD